MDCCSAQGTRADAERGQRPHSDDFGKSWRYLDAGSEGTFCSGAALADGSLQSKSSVTTIVAAERQVLVAGLDGLLVRSRNGGIRSSGKTPRMASGWPPCSLEVIDPSCSPGAA